MSEERRSPWEWRKASGGWTMLTDPPDRRLFHAFDVNDSGACEPGAGLWASCEEPNEGSELCRVCIDVVKAEPAGREKRVYREACG